MEVGKNLEFSERARRLMARRGLSEVHAWFCMFNHKREYKVGQETVWACVLPDGRNIKVRVIETSDKFIVTDAFTHR